MIKVVSFGEIMLRLSTDVGKKFSNSSNLSLNYGGAEANFLVSLANFSPYFINSSFFTVLPNNQFGLGCYKNLKSLNIDVSNIKFDSSLQAKMGVYFLELGQSIRPYEIIYDRKNSSVSNVDIGSIDYQSVLKDVNWFHFTGITPSLSNNCLGVLKTFLSLIKNNKDNKITVSCDLNYRSKLWSKEDATVVMKDLAKYIDVCIGNEDDFSNMLGKDKFKSHLKRGALDIKDYVDMLDELYDEFGFRYTISTIRESVSSSNNIWSAIGFDGTDFYESKKYDLNNIIDRVGTGDAFSAGFVYGLLKNMSFADSIEFGIGASALKFTYSGDFNYATETEVYDLVKNGNVGKLNR